LYAYNPIVLCAHITPTSQVCTVGAAAPTPCYSQSLAPSNLLNPTSPSPSPRHSMPCAHRCWWAAKAAKCSPSLYALRTQVLVGSEGGKVLPFTLCLAYSGAGGQRRRQSAPLHSMPCVLRCWWAAKAVKCAPSLYALRTQVLVGSEGGKMLPFTLCLALTGAGGQRRRQSAARRLGRHRPSTQSVRGG